MKRMGTMILVLGLLLSAQSALADWGAARRLTWTADASDTPAVAVGTTGSVHVAWSDYTPGNPEIYYKNSPYGGTTWGANKRLTWTAGSSQTPAMGTGPGNAVHVAWSDDTPGNPEIYYRTSGDGGTVWNAVQRLTSTPGKSYSPALAISSGTTLYVVWEDDTPGNYELHYRRSGNRGSTWAAVQRLTWTSGDSVSPTAAVDSSGSAHVAWSDYSTGNPDLYYRSRPAGSATWNALQRLTWTLEDSAAPAMAVDTAGNIHIVWSDFTPGNYEVYYKRGT
jgi:hypothetical protein